MKEIPKVVIFEIRAKPTHVMGWFNSRLVKVWKFIFPLTAKSVKDGMMALTNLAWKEVLNPWWDFLMDVHSPMEEHRLKWELLPQISPMPILCDMNPSKFLSERRILEDRPISTCIIGNRVITKLIQIFQPTTEFNLHVLPQKMEMEVLQHNLMLIPGKGQTKEMLKRIG